MNTYQPPPFPIPYGNAPRSLNPQWPNVNLYGEQLVEPQPNPYFAHWPQNLGQTETETVKSSLMVPVAVGGVALLVGYLWGRG